MPKISRHLGQFFSLNKVCRDSWEMRSLDCFSALLCVACFLPVIITQQLDASTLTTKTIEVLRMTSFVVDDRSLYYSSIVRRKWKLLTHSRRQAINGANQLAQSHGHVELSPVHLGVILFQVPAPRKTICQLTTIDTGHRRAGAQGHQESRMRSDED